VIFVLKHNPWGIGKLGVVRVKGGFLRLVGCMRTFGFDFIESLFLGEGPHLFGGGTVEGGANNSLPWLEGELAVCHNINYNSMN